MRSTHLFNHDWYYVAEDAPVTVSDDRFEGVVIPHSNTMLPWHNFDDAEYQFVSTYRKRFTLPEPLHNRRVYLDFEGVMQAATVTINGHTFEEHKGGFVPFSYDITDYIDEAGENLLQVRVDSHERADIPPHGGEVDYLVFGGIYRDVHLRYVNPVHISNLRVRTSSVLDNAAVVEVDVWVRNLTSEEVTVKARGMMQEGTNRTDPRSSIITIAQHSAVMTVAPESDGMVTITLLSGEDSPYQLWSLDDPKLYTTVVTLRDADRSTDMMWRNFGIREAVFREDGFYLNGEKVFLRGLNRHQMYPFVGMAVGERLQERDADIIKSMGCNIVRTSHYPQSKYFLDRCDEIGLLVFEEIPGWQHIGDADWQALSLRDVRVMIERDWNHPSIVIWGVRINESGDDTEFYTRTNALARELDPTRQTTGVRFFPTSEYLEDVYSYNDFTNGVLEPTQSPWLITEYNGHMFPTKTYDNEERQHEHVRRHAYIQAQAMSTGGVSGAIGWCAFDYNTHLDFGSGDRVCYHGVLDMWRQPKWAAYVYKSQLPRETELVMELATFWTMGDRSEGGNDPFYVLTNVEAVEVTIGEEYLGRYEPAHQDFPNLPHPPIKVDGMPLLWGGKFKQLRVVGFVDGEPVAERLIEADSIPRHLVAYAEDEELKADGMDMTRIVFKITDIHGNRLPYAIQPVHFEVLSGDAQLIGENPFALVGGQAALFLRAGQQAGEVRIRVTTPRLDAVEVVVSLV